MVSRRFLPNSVESIFVRRLFNLLWVPKNVVLAKLEVQISAMIRRALDFIVEE